MTKLSTSVCLNDLKQLIKDKNKSEIAEFVRERFSERYIYPIKKLNPNDKHGFSIMAVSCLMIELLTSFKLGYENTKDKSKKTFVRFFSCEPEFIDFKGNEENFYTNVRCGILHQSETTDGWKIRRKGQLFDSQKKNNQRNEILR